MIPNVMTQAATLRGLEPSKTVGSKFSWPGDESSLSAALQGDSEDIFRHDSEICSSATRRQLAVPASSLEPGFDSDINFNDSARHFGP
jgi:hypothetical protein